MLFQFSSLVPAVAALLAVLGLVLLAGRAARFTGLSKAGHAKRLALHDTLILDRARRLHIVRCDGRDVLLLTGGGSDFVVGWLSGEGATS